MCFPQPRSEAVHLSLEWKIIVCHWFLTVMRSIVFVKTLLKPAVAHLLVTCMCFGYFLSATGGRGDRSCPRRL